MAPSLLRLAPRSTPTSSNHPARSHAPSRAARGGSSTSASRAWLRRSIPASCVALLLLLLTASLLRALIRPQSPEGGAGSGEGERALRVYVVLLPAPYNVDLIPLAQVTRAPRGPLSLIVSLFPGSSVYTLALSPFAGSSGRTALSPHLLPFLGIPDLPDLPVPLSPSPPVAASSEAAAVERAVLAGAGGPVGVSVPCYPHYPYYRQHAAEYFLTLSLLSGNPPLLPPLHLHLPSLSLLASHLALSQPATAPPCPSLSFSPPCCSALHRVSSPHPWCMPEAARHRGTWPAFSPLFLLYSPTPLPPRIPPRHGSDILDPIIARFALCHAATPATPATSAATTTHGSGGGSSSTGSGSSGSGSRASSSGSGGGRMPPLVVPCVYPLAMFNHSLPLAAAIKLAVDLDLHWAQAASYDRDVIVPYVPLVAPFSHDRGSWASRPLLLFFQGTTDRWGGGIIRQQLQRELQGQPGVQFTVGRAENSSMTAQAATAMRRAKYCLVPRGDTSSSCRLFDAVLSGCIPVIISDALDPPFEDVIDYTAFSLLLPAALAVRPGYILGVLHAQTEAVWRQQWEAMRKDPHHLLFSLPPGGKRCGVAALETTQNMVRCGGVAQGKREEEQVAHHFIYYFLPRPGKAEDMVWRGTREEEQDAWHECTPATLSANVPPTPPHIPPPQVAHHFIYSFPPRPGGAEDMVWRTVARRVRGRFSPHYRNRRGRILLAQLAQAGLNASHLEQPLPNRPPVTFDVTLDNET
ncbi:unnamed protein product [Closterium sp. NIES-65]|nr:unnamed protein product [Closterium sp. NIES-65]